MVNDNEYNTKRYLSMDNNVDEIETVEGEDDSLSEYQNGYNQGYIDALADISEIINKLKERKDYDG